MEEKKIIIICGEPSGDLHAGNLARELKQIDPRIKISGVGGAGLRQHADEIYHDIKDLSVFGLFDVLKRLPLFLSLKKLLLQKIKEDKPAAVIFVDFGGFNLRLAKEINNTIPTIYYVSPQVWASRPGRIKTIRKYIRKMIVIFKFEEEFYKKHGIDAEFFGHPLLDIVKPTMSKKELPEKLGFLESKATIALLPGSRRQEIKNILPIMLKAASIILKGTQAQFVIAKSPQVGWEIYNSLIKDSGLEIKVVEGKTYDCLNTADFSLVCSGTATLEAAIIGKPFSVVYKMNILNYLLYRPQVRIPYIGMVNIVAGKMIIPEFVQFRARPKKIAQKTLEILKSPLEIEEIKNNLSHLKSTLGQEGACARAAESIYKSI
ncbi:MAG: lipid-A-disaccharide synthase [Candidatus Omnitrophica bacterium]|nr:lipid-A-disaccharide synthase [Candidatus Omnitrophota bacterium]